MISRVRVLIWNRLRRASTVSACAPPQSITMARRSPIRITLLVPCPTSTKKTSKVPPSVLLELVPLYRWGFRRRWQRRPYLLVGAGLAQSRQPTHDDGPDQAPRDGMSFHLSLEAIPFVQSGKFGRHLRQVYSLPPPILPTDMIGDRTAAG